MDLQRTVDVVVIGGGIAGVTAGAHLAERGLAVVLVEREPHLAWHTTGRSAAQYLENYDGPLNSRLTIASRAGFAEGPFLQTRPLLGFGGPDAVDALRAEAAAGQRLVPSIRFVDGDEVRRICPAIRPEFAAAGVFEPEAADIDVALLHQSYVQRLRAAGGRVVTAAGEVRPRRVDGVWEVGEERAPIVVNAAGAWGDVVATAAGVRPIGLQPMRRTAFLCPAPPGSEGWPLAYFHGAETFYIKPEPGGNLLCSLAEETPSAPCDAKPEEVDVALTLDRIDGVTTLGLRHVRRAWAGLRTFSPDRNQVIGFDPDADGFFWLVGQGGTGIQTAPAQGEVTAALVCDGRLPRSVVELGVTEADLSPARFH